MTESLAVEFLIEPFTPGEPGPHVTAALGAFTERNLEVELGPFATTSQGPIDLIAEALADAFRRSIKAGATSIRVQLAPEAERLTGRNLHDTRCRR